MGTSDDSRPDAGAAPEAAVASPDIRTAERLLRAGGFSRRQARALLAGGWKAMETPRAPPPAPKPAPEVDDELRRLLVVLQAALKPGR